MSDDLTERVAVSEVENLETDRRSTEGTPQLEDTQIACMDCGESFVWTAGEQVFFRDKNLLNPPKRCKDCKKAKNLRLDAIEKAKVTGERHRIEVKANCARCSNPTTVPFYPSQGRPVFCRTCFLELNGKPK